MKAYRYCDSRLGLRLNDDAFHTLNHGKNKSNRTILYRKIQGLYH